MEFKHYREAVKITLAELGSKLANNHHMVEGLGGELGEIVLAVRSGDNINLGEELSDVSWFGTSWANINSLEISSGIYNVGDCEDPVDTLGKIENFFYKLFRKKTTLKYPVLFRESFDDLIITISEIIDLEKKQSAYGKEQYDSDRSYLANSLFKTLSYCYFYGGIDVENSLQKNIDKLMVRYNKKKFEAEKANNRNLIEERKVLEGK